MPRLRKLTHMCSRTISGTAYRFRHGSTLCSPTVEKILCRSLFSKRSHIGNLRQIRKQGKGRSSKRKENRRCPFLFALRRGYGAVPAAGAATLPPSADGESPPLRFSEKLPARQGRTRLRQFVCPGHLVPRKEKHRRIASTVLKVCTFTQIAAAYRHPYAPVPAGPVPDDRAR